MRERLIQRRDELTTELAAGEARVKDLESQLQALRNTLLRIGGAIQVLNEEIERPETD